ncbi:BppU family phage baseplate upper protein [Alkalihalobacillus trypoxylicola]|uniref:BppU N-terminal domain-containing protein n=1 Tax=Alkalihalobacillus trypoxylicola TaxID=519424 RepID=A0A161P9E4_9BACI|nr:BppU family phage baseplate upper protein [Alkalihalobacillus trypoxylicola]KYG27670.1 hypothetical protein AZF04_10795 [Alkalihalobacillus trypoxylicola]
MIFHFKQGSTNQTLTLSLKSFDVDIDLSNSTVRFIMTDHYRQNLLIDELAVIESINEGTVSYTFHSGQTELTGTFKAEFEVYGPNNQFKVFPNKEYLRIKIHPKLRHLQQNHSSSILDGGDFK